MNFDDSHDCEIRVDYDDSYRIWGRTEEFDLVVDTPIRIPKRSALGFDLVVGNFGA